jgi:hypothetical protein
LSTSAFPALLGTYRAGTTTEPPGILVSGGTLRAPATLSRAQVTSRATAIGADDATLQVFAADTPRFAGSARRLVSEGQRTNEIAAPLSFTTGWTATSGGTGTAPVVTANYGPIAAPDGSFTATRLQLDRGAGTAATDLSGLTRATAASSSRFVWVRTVSGTATVQIGTNSTSAGVQSSVDTTWRRLGVTDTSATHRIMLVGSAGNSQAADLLVWGASSEANTVFPSSLILPPVGSTQSSTRGADLVVVSGASLGIPASGACTILWSGRMGQLATGTAQTIAQLDDGSVATRWVVDNQPTTANIRVFGSSGGSAAIGTATPGTPFRLGVAINGSGRAAGSFNGGAVAAATGGPSSGFTTLRLGVNASGAASMFGETLYFQVLPTTLSDADLVTAVAALPL